MSYALTTRILAPGLVVCLSMIGWAVEKPVPLESVETNRLTGAIVAELASGYLTSSGSLCDSRPILWHELDLSLDLGRWGWLEGYGWAWDALQGGQSNLHRELLAEFEGAVYHGYSFGVVDRVAFKNLMGMLWNPPIGYYDDCNQYWGPMLIQSLENPYLTPYMNSLWLMQPRQRSRTRLGVRRQWHLSEEFTFRSAFETVWSDGRRYRAKFGSSPEQSFLGGGFGSMRADFRLRWQISKALAGYVRMQEYLALGGQARRHIRDQEVYWAKTSRTVVGIGVEYAF